VSIGTFITLSTSFQASGIKVPMDTDKISQVLLNLYLNAIQAMENGGTLLVKTGFTKKGCLKIEISDNGIGIGKKDLPNIFEPYFSTKSVGTGLGLAIVHNIVRAHKGEIKVESRMGKGTTITLLLPVKEDG